MMETKVARRAVAFREFIAHARERLGLTMGFRLWDGSTVPADLAPESLSIVIADENGVAALVRRPTLDTLANLWVAGRIDLAGGTLFELVQRRPSVKTREFRKTLDKGRAMKLALQFLFLPRGALGRWRR